MKKIVVAIDSFKGCLSSLEVAEAIEVGVASVYPSCQVIKVPIADGGEGMLGVLLSVMKGKRICIDAHDPLMNPLYCSYGISGDGKTAFVEMAEASGLPLVPFEKRNPLLTTTFGTGELIKEALDQGCRKFILGIGGSATNDAGLGMLQALGYRFLDKNGQLLGFGGQILSEVASIDDSSVHPGLKESKFTVACDVNNPFHGKSGAAHVFAKQKGASDEMILELDRGLQSLAGVILESTGKDISNYPGAGAAGGMGGGLLAFLNAELKPGIQLLLDMVDFNSLIKDADLIITGEGKIDRQTPMGKVAKGVLDAATPLEIPVIAIAGGIEDVKDLNKAGFHAVFSTCPGPISLEKAMQFDFAKENITRTLIQIFKTIQLFHK